ncbi:MAG: PhoH family protein [Proteobacteria bacterium]|nr:PhoH family protein [Pseudomonadota bacterium]
MVKKSEFKEVEIKFNNNDLVIQLFGEHNGHLKKISKLLGVSINARGTTVKIEGDEASVKLSEKVLKELYGLLKEKYPIFPNDIDFAVRTLSSDSKTKLKDVFLDTVFVSTRKKAIAPKNPSQKKYIDAIRNHDVVFGIGPAGTGKTYLAVAMAVSALSKGLVNRIILTRPAVEAGEALGFLPGNLSEKVDPYLRPLYDALHDMLSYEKFAALMEKGIIEVAPLAFMRGRTLNDAFIILDEAQNTTSEQMKMFLTRIGFNSKAVITGDITQIDLPSSKKSGLVEANKILSDIKGLKFVYYSKEDVVRHRLVMKIITAYEKVSNN